MLCYTSVFEDGILVPWNVPEVLRPLYESSTVLAQKASMANVPPAVLLRLLREHRSEWADNSIDIYSAAATKVGPCRLPGTGVWGFVVQDILPLAHTIEHEELLEVVKLENVGHCSEDGMISRNMFLLQEASSPNCTLDLASSLESGAGNRASSDHSSNPGTMRSVMTIAFEFAFESHMQDSVAAMTRQYVRSIISSVQRLALALSPSLGSNGLLWSPLGTPEANTLARWICSSYRCYLVVDLLKCNSEGSETMLKTLWHLSDAVMCCSLKSRHCQFSHLRTRRGWTCWRRRWLRSRI